jgi:hypothetical protein
VHIPELASEHKSIRRLLMREVSALWRWPAKSCTEGGWPGTWYAVSQYSMVWYIRRPYR